MKRLVSLVLSLLMVLSMFVVAPISASAQTTLDNNKVFIKADGKYYEVEKGQTYTYTYYLNVPNAKISSFDATTSYDTEGLDFVPTVDEYGDDALDVMFPIMRSVVMNYRIDSKIYYNYANVTGVRFPKEDSVVFTGEFLVTADSGVYEIDTQLETLADVDMNKLVYNCEKLGEFTESQAMPELIPVDEVVIPTQVETAEPTQVQTEEPTIIPIPTEIATVEPTEKVTEAPTAEPTEEETQIQTEEPTKESAPPVPGDYILLVVDGVYYNVEQGDIFTYEYNLACSENIGSIDVHTTYDSYGLELIPTVDEYGDHDLSAMFPVLNSVVYNFDLEDRILFNYVSLSPKGISFPVPEDGVYTQKNQVCVLKFKVTASAGVLTINTRINTLGGPNAKKLIFNYEVVTDSALISYGGAAADMTPIYPTEAPTFAPTVAKPTEAPTNEPTQESTVDPTKPEEEQTVYLVNSGNWYTPMVYSWNINGDSNTMWPGDFMTKTGETASNGAEIYEFTFSREYDNLIFNNGGFAQTSDLQFMEDMYYDVVTECWYSSPDDIPVVTPTEPNTDSTEVVGGEIHIVAGIPELCGSGWDPSDKNNLMTYNAQTGVYEKVYENVGAGHYEFKVTTDYAWDNGDYNLEGDAKYGGPNAVAKVEQDGSTVIIGFDGEKAILTIIAPNEYPTEVEPSVAPTTEPTEEETQDPTESYGNFNVYLMNSADWHDPHTYAWRDADSYEDVMSWPGMRLKLIGHIGNVEIYKYTFSKVYDKIIFSDSGVPQTPDLDFKYDMIYDNSTGKWLEMSTLDTMVEVEEPTEDETTVLPTNPIDLPTVGPKPPVYDTVTVYLIDSALWNGAYVYLWTETEEGVDALALWPGVKMELVGYQDNSVGVYSYTFDSKYTNIIFDFDGKQSQDSYVVPNGIYDNSQDRWVQLPIDPIEPVVPTEVESQPTTAPVAPTQPEPTQPRPGGGYGDSSDDRRELGDINGDGKISVFDASYIQKHIAGYDGYTDFEETDFAIADVNGDGKINIFDVSHIQKFIAGYFDSFI